MWRFLGGGDSERLGERGRFGRLCAVDVARGVVVFAWLVLGIVAFEVDGVDDKTCLLVPRG